MLMFAVANLVVLFQIIAVTDANINILLHCALAAVQCIAIDPVCVFAAVGRRVFVGLLP